jgi:hypothetical protein
MTYIHSQPRSIPERELPMRGPSLQGSAYRIWNLSHGRPLFEMTDALEMTVAPAAVERALTIFEQFKERDHAELVQARKAPTEHIFGLIATGQTDEQRLVVSGLTHLKSIERMTGRG